MVLSKMAPDDIPIVIDLQYPMILLFSSLKPRFQCTFFLVIVKFPFKIHVLKFLKIHYAIYNGFQIYIQIVLQPYGSLEQYLQNIISLRTQVN